MIEVNEAHLIPGHLLIAAASLLLFVFSTLFCLYCFKWSASDSYDEEKEPVKEKMQFCRGESLDSHFSTEKTGKVFWDRLHNLFSTSSSKSIAIQAKNSRSSSNSLYEKPPMGTMSVTLVQPQNQDVVSGSSPVGESRNSISLSKGNDRTAAFSSSFLPEAFRKSFDMSFEVTDDLRTERLGKLEFTTIYYFIENTLCVHVIKATNLPAMDLSGTSDPFVKCFLLPDRKRKLETKIKRKTLNPTWKERLSFEGLAYEKIKQRVLYLEVLDYDRFSRNDPIGEIYLPLHTVNLSEEIHHVLPLQPCEGSNKRGELLLSLCYEPIEGFLNVEIVKARNLKPMDLNGTSDPYVKVWLLNRGKKIEKKKTEIFKNTLNPNFGQKFLFQVPMSKLRDIQLEIAVMDHDLIKRNDTIGKIYLGHKSSGLEKQHWKDMLANVRVPVSQWHVLKN